MKKSVINFSALVAVLVCFASCVYPFTPEIPSGESGVVVIEGDIFIGEVFPVKVTYSSPLSMFYMDATPVDAKVWVEDSKGAAYYGIRSENGVSYLDLSDADPSLEYCLHVINNETSREYVSTFSRCCTAPEIDSLSYIPDEVNDKLNIALSMHAKDESFFRWTYVEDWQYQSHYNASVKYKAPEMSWSFWGAPIPKGNGTIEKMVWPESTHNCWGHKESNEIMIFSTEKQNDDRFVDLEFHPIARDDIKISHIYHIEVNLEPLTRDAYIYWDNINKNNKFSGSLFAPVPSQMTGNITCLQDKGEEVIGFINVAQRARKKLYLHNYDVRFYKSSERIEDPLVPDESRWYDLYNSGYLPYKSEYDGPSLVYYWANKRCVDCTALGGSLEQPEWWLKDE